MLLLPSAILLLVTWCQPGAGQNSPVETETSPPGPVIARHDDRFHVRLFNATDTGQYIYGAVELSKDGESWGYACAEDFQGTNGLVLCKMYGYSKGEVIAGGRLGESSNSRFAERLICSPRDAGLGNCIAASLRQSSDCSSDSTVGVICFNSTQAVLDMRLVDGSQSATQISGRLEVRLTPITAWGTVCDDNFNDRSATAACRYLGYQYGQDIVHEGWDWLFADTGVFGSGEQTFLDEVFCEEDQNFLDCDHDPWGYHDCSPAEDVGIQCMNTTVRLLSAIEDDPAIGSVELFLSSDGGWFEVCDEDWDDDDAKVVCRDLGFADGKALRRNTLGLVSYGSLTAMGSVTRVNCTGSEPNLDVCAMETTDLCEFHDSIIDLAAVICYATPASEVNMTDAVRISSDPGASSKVGYVEVRHLGVWGRICEDSRVFEFPAMGDAEVKVVCRMAGYAGGKRIASVLSDASHHIWLRGMRCTGDESSIDECQLPRWGSPGLSECEAPVRVLCYENDPPTIVPDTPLSRSGYASISLDGEETNICADQWTDLDAAVACREMGYSTGGVWTHPDGQPGLIQSDTVLRGVQCPARAGSFMECITGEFGVSPTKCASGPAGFACYEDLKLEPNSGGCGVPQFYDNRSGRWSSLCGIGFTDTDAQVVCRQLGYLDGEAVPLGAFGPFPASRDPLAVTCTGRETSLAQCRLAPHANCTQQSTYAAVACFNVSDPTSSDQFRLDAGYSDPNTITGIVRVKRHNAWGYACDESFTDNDAHALCTDLGASFTHGVKFSPTLGVIGPYWIRNPSCGQGVSTLRDCQNPDYFCTESRAATVICSTTDKAKFVLEASTGRLSGRVQVEVNGQIGAICADTWNDNAATVFCKQRFRNAVTGVATTMERGSLPYFLGGIRCVGTEYNLFECQSDGWRNLTAINMGCHVGGGLEPGVTCYTNVVLHNGHSSADSMSGQLNVIRFGLQRSVCFDETFNMREARLVCEELGLNQAAILKPYRGDDLDEYYMMKRFNCPEEARSLVDCAFSIGYCPFGQVRLLCYQDPVSAMGLWDIKDSALRTSGPLVVDLPGQFRAVVCPVGFTDRNATSVCQAKKAQSFTGKALGSVKFGANYEDALLGGREPVWFRLSSCSDSSGTVQCTLDNSVPRACFNQSHAAGVLCADNSVTRIHLVDHTRETTRSGRVEILYEGVWGTVCSSALSHNQAQTLCRELGYPNGTSLARSPKRFGQASGPIYVKDVHCQDRDRLFLGCTNAGWEVTDGCTHEDDLEVQCRGHEQFFPEPDRNYGAVASFVDDRMFLVCSADFGRHEAQVFCRGQGYPGGVPICCSGIFEDRRETPAVPIELRYVCDGTESTLKNCTEIRLPPDGCPTRQYASAACLDSASSDTMRIRLGKIDEGRVEITYYGVTGLVCGDDFTHKDASVICKERNYRSGLAFVTADRNNASVFWASNLRCSGSENRIEQCPGFSLGQTYHCASVASVVCLGDNDDNSVLVRLLDSPARGTVEVGIKGVWGPLCLRDMPYRAQFNTEFDPEANVLCRQLGFTQGGNFLVSNMFEQSSGPVQLAGIRCQGNESRISECQLQRWDDQECSTHQYDAALQCYVGAQLQVIPPIADDSHGILQVRKDGARWHRVCDTGITDREATVVCRTLGFSFGRTQCCNAVGGRTDMSHSVTQITCRGDETAITMCDISTEGSCSSGQYAYLHCSKFVFPEENLRTFRMEQFYGNATVERFGLRGGVCADGFSDNEAQVMCRELGYNGGQAIHPFTTNMDYLFMLNGLNCSGSETRIDQCSVPTLAQAGGCSSGRAAMILCLNDNADIVARIGNGGLTDSGAAELILDGRVMYIDTSGQGVDHARMANVFCRSVADKGYAYGLPANRVVPGTVPSGSILMTNVNCQGREKSILDCAAEYSPHNSAANVSRSRLLYVDCNNGVQLESGPSQHSGVLTLYNENIGEFGAVCMKEFGQNEAEVACRQLGYDHGTVHCCMPFGYTFLDITFRNVKCEGTESSLRDCQIDMASQFSYYYCDNSQNYVGVTCYSGNEPQTFNISIQASSVMNPNTGILKLTHLGTPGTICNDHWGDDDATVACRELGYSGGSAYFHFRSSFSETEGPFWTSKFGCQGTESRLSDCPHSKLGDITTCESGHYAGVLCYEGSEIEFRIAGTSQPHYGRVEAYVAGRWGGVCDIYWDVRDAAVMCRTMGYLSGDVFDTSELSQETGPAFELGPRCRGTETHINQCPHDGWTLGSSEACAQRIRDAGVFCYTSVRLGTGSGKSFSFGPVNYYDDGTWFRVCDDGFTDTSARKVCEELGYFDGRAICCSAFDGESTSREMLHPNITMKCTGPEESLSECIREETCNSDKYASVVCFEESDTIDETTYTFSMQEDFRGSGRIDVTHLGVKGRVCSQGWSDLDAQVYCKGQGFNSGFAYQHSYDQTYASASTLGPFLMSDVQCTGEEASLDQCPFSDRLHLDNCTDAHTAAAVCFNEEGVKYRLSGGEKPNVGRIEMSIDGQWGTVCGRFWKDEDSHVACRSLGFTDGETQDEGIYGPGEGPIWLRYPQCEGDEPALHHCPHTGYQISGPDEGIFAFLARPCRTHSDDATMFCYKDAKLNQRLGVNSGALLFSPDQKGWQHVCHMDGFSRSEAQVACRSLLQDYVDGVPILGGLFGELETEMGVSSIHCTGTESTLSECSVVASTNCSSDGYVSVACFENILTPEDTRFKLRLSDDTLRTSNNHGIVEIRQEGVWGRICMQGFTDTEAAIACKELGNFTGGTKYLHLFRNRLPILWGPTRCSGDEVSLNQCRHESPVGNDKCGYESNDAGVLCYMGEGVRYRLTGGPDASSGRVELGVDGDYGTICAINWKAANSRVLCRDLGYVDGVVSHEPNDDLPALPTKLSFFLCDGDEDKLLSCLNSGFDGGSNVFVCAGDAYTMCFNEEVEIIDIRLGDSATTAGRVEVRVSGLNEWGTICDDEWDDLDATVVCKYLGFDGGKASFEGHSEGSGKILLDNVECNGTESTLAQCVHEGINTHNCEHSEDAGVVCFNITTPVLPETTQPPHITTIPPTTKKSNMSTRIPPETTKLATTQRPTTAPPTTGATTRAPTTPKEPPTTRRPRPPRTTTKRPTTTTLSSGEAAKSGGSNDGGKTRNIVLVVITILVALVLLVVVVLLLLRYRIRRKGTAGGDSNGFNHMRFHNEDTLQQAPDGSIGVSNQMYDVSSADGDPITSFMAEGAEIRLGRSGLATFSKSSPSNTAASTNGDPHEGFSNPLYAATKEVDLVSPTDVRMDLGNGENNGQSTS